MKVATLFLLCSAGALQAQKYVHQAVPSPKVTIANVAETPREHKMRLLWIASIGAMTAGTAADAYSSWHKQESNGILASSNGTFGAKGVAIKCGIASAVLVPQIIFRRHRDWHLAFAASNFTEAGIFAGVTAHNLAVKYLIIRRSSFFGLVSLGLMLVTAVRCACLYPSIPAALCQSLSP